MATRCEAGYCPYEQTILTLREKVIEGNGTPSLQEQTRRMGDEVDELKKIVKGDGETTGLQPHMIALQAGLRFVKWEIGIGLLVLGMLISLFGVLMTERAGDHKVAARSVRPAETLAQSTAVVAATSPRGTQPAR